MIPSVIDQTGVKSHRSIGFRTPRIHVQLYIASICPDFKVIVGTATGLTEQDVVNAMVGWR